SQPPTAPRASVWAFPSQPSAHFESATTHPGAPGLALTLPASVAGIAPRNQAQMGQPWAFVMFHGSLPALITPFRNGILDEQGLQGFVEWQIAEGSHG